MSSSNWVHLEVTEILRETDKAILVLLDDEELWIPLSQIADSDDYSVGDTDCVISVTEWFAKQSNLEIE